MKSVVHAHTTSEESVTCIAAKEEDSTNRLQLRVAKFMDLLGYREVTLKSDTEPAITDFRNRVAENVQRRSLKKRTH